MGIVKSLAGRTITLWISRLAAMAPPIVLAPALIRSLGLEGFGQYTLLIAVYVTVDQVVQSIQQVLVRFVPHHEARGETEYARRYIRSVFLMTMGGHSLRR
jgi:O-antigen/teichoic acid export membrane protein